MADCSMSDGSFLLDFGILLLAAGAILLVINHRQKVQGHSGSAQPPGASAGSGWSRVGDHVIHPCPQGDDRSQQPCGLRLRGMAAEPYKSPLGTAGLCRGAPVPQPPVRTGPVSPAPRRTRVAGRKTRMSGCRAKVLGTHGRSRDWFLCYDLSCVECRKAAQEHQRQLRAAQRRPWAAQWWDLTS